MAATSTAMRLRSRALLAAVLAAALAGGIAASALATHHAGRYAGSTSQGKTMRFTISADGRYVENVRVDFSYPCRGETTRGGYFGDAGRYGFRARIRDHRTFARRRDEALFVVELRGRLAGRRASGTIRFTSTGGGSGDVPASDEPCDSGPIAWTAKLRPRRPVG